MLNELERHLARLQERIEYFSIKKDKKNPVLFKKVKGLIGSKFNKLKTLFKKPGFQMFFNKPEGNKDDQK